MDKSAIGRALSARDDENKSEVGRLLVSLRRTQDGQCQGCGKAITGRATRMYCGPACTQAAYRERKAEAELAPV